MRSLISFFLLECLLLAPWASAQQDRWQNLEQIKSGNKVEVIDRQLRRYTGKFVRFSEDEFTFLVDNKESTLAKTDVYRVTVVGKNRKRNLLLGLAVGAGAGAAIGAVILEREPGYNAAMAGSVVGFTAIGAGIGAIAPADKTLYRVPEVRQAKLRGSD